MSVQFDALPTGSANTVHKGPLRPVLSRAGTMCLVELQKLRHDRTELVTRAIQPALERDAGVLAKLLVTPTPRIALVTGKAFAAGIRAVVQALVVLILAAILGVGLTPSPLKLTSPC